MFKGFYTVASGMLTQQRKTEMLSNNMANANTPGFKSDQASLRAFPAMLMNRLDLSTKDGESKAGSKTIGSLNTGVYMQEAAPNFAQGSLKATEQKTDMALIDISMPINQESGEKGSVFYTVRNSAGETRYTRNGDFTIDSQGYLTTGSGMYLLDTNGNPILLGDDQFSLDKEGVLTSSSGQTFRLGIGYTEDALSLIKEGDGLYRTEDGNELQDAYNTNGIQFQTQQGYLENSNVDVSKTMTEMMTSYRAFEANQKVLQAYDQSMQKAVNEVGRIG